MIDISNTQDFNNQILGNQAVLAYFSHEKCNVCQTLKPKIKQQLPDQFPKLIIIFIDTEKLPEVAGQQRIFTAPVIIIYFEGKESFRFVRNISISELAKTINRPYQLLIS